MMTRTAVFTLLISCIMALPVRAETLRVATYNAALTREGPGLLLRDILAEEEQVQAVVEVIAHAAPDVLLITRIDYDHGRQALTALAGALRAAGQDYPYLFTLRPNSGMATGLDLDGDGRLGTADDAQGYGRFAGSGGMAVLSRFPVGEARDFSDFLWRDLPGALLPEVDGQVFPSNEIYDHQRLASVGAWDVPVQTPDGPLHLLAFYAGPPVFGGPHQRNLRRNHDEVAFWSAFLDGHLPMPAPDAPFVLLGDANLDPDRGDGMRSAMRVLLSHPRLQDPLPSLPTARWPDLEAMRVDYVLPSEELAVRRAGVVSWAPGLAPGVVDKASRHGLVWVDIVLPGALP